MRTVAHSFFVLALLAAPLASAVRADAPEAEAPKPRLESVWFRLATAATEAQGAAAQQAVAALEGVESFTWNADRTEAKLVRRAGHVATDALVAALARHELRASPIEVATTTLVFQKKLHCNGCAAKVRRALLAVAGTKETAIAEDRGSVAIAHEPKVATVARLREAVAAAGYPARD